eukprot:366206-Chlamydomonas_euryale.AAC.2
MSVWSTAVLAMAMATAVLLPLCGIPLWGRGGSLYRAMGVLTAGSPCALALCPLVYVCAVAAVSRRGVLLKSAGVLDALAQVCQPRSCAECVPMCGATVRGNCVGTLSGALCGATHCGGTVRDAADAHLDTAMPGMHGPSCVSCDTFMHGPGCVHTVALDKTGTLTMGSLALAEASILCGEDAGLRAATGNKNRACVSSTRLVGKDLSPLSSPVDALSLSFISKCSSSSGISSCESNQIDSTSCGSSSNSNSSSSSSSGSSSSNSSGSSDSSGSSTDQKTATALPSVLFGTNGSMALCCALALSRASNHPVARAMVEAAGTPDVCIASVSDFEQVPGMGMHGVVALHCLKLLRMPAHVFFGGADFVLDRLQPGGQAHAALAEHVAAASRSSALQSFVAIIPCGADASAEPLVLVALSFEDCVAEGAARAVAMLRAGGSGVPPLHVAMLTGDRASVAEQVAASLGIETFIADMSPKDKLRFVSGELACAQGARSEALDSSLDKAAPWHTPFGLLMMGDGINDAPALAAAHVGVAVADCVGDLVAAVADVVVLNGRGTSNLPLLMRVAHKTKAVVVQNVVLALASMVVAALPTLVGLFPLWLAVMLHEGATLLVVLNSLRLLLDDVPCHSAKGM